MGKSKLLACVAFGAVVGAVVSMLDKSTREQTIETTKKVKETVSYYAENREELKALAQSKVAQAQSMYSSVSGPVQALLQSGEKDSLPKTIQSLVSETVQAFSKKEDDLI